jgi:hypothetical protein
MRLLAIALLALGPCSDPPPDPGGKLPPLELQIVRWDDHELVPVADGAAIPLALAPQGGHFAFVAARVKNLEGADVEMNALAVDDATGTLIGAAVARPFMSSGADGWSDPEHETFTTLDMVQFCPRGVGLDLDGRDIKLTLHVTEHSTSREADASVIIRPDCAGSAACECECAADFRPGSCP